MEDISETNIIKSDETKVVEYVFPLTEPEKPIITLLPSGANSDKKVLTATQRAKKKYREKFNKSEYGKEKNREYLKKYYDKHKEEINIKNRQRRNEDPEYRKYVSEASRKYREKKRLQELQK